MNVFFIAEINDTKDETVLYRMLLIADELYKMDIEPVFFLKNNLQLQFSFKYKVYGWERIAEFTCKIKHTPISTTVFMLYIPEGFDRSFMKLNRLGLLFVLEDKNDIVPDAYINYIKVNFSISPAINETSRKHLYGARFTPVYKPSSQQSSIPFEGRKGIIIYSHLLLKHDININTQKYTIIDINCKDDFFKAVACGKLAQSILLITDDSTILPEAAYCGTPAVLYGEHEYSLASKTFPLNINIHSTFNIYTLPLLNKKEWTEASKEAMALINGDGAGNIAESIRFEAILYQGLKKSFIYKEFSVKNFVECSTKELILMHKTRNSKEVLSNSVHNEPISISSFIAFANSLFRIKNSGYWLVYLNKDPLGVFSLTTDGISKTAVLGYYKLLGCKTPRIGRILIDISKYTAFSVLGLDSVVAECFQDNEKSIKSIKNSGMKIVNKTYLNGKVVECYQYNNQG